MSANLALVTSDSEPHYDPWSDPRGKVPVDTAALTACVQRAIREQAPQEERHDCGSAGGRS